MDLGALGAVGVDLGTLGLDLGVVGIIMILILILNPPGAGPRVKEGT